jgi:hypothetical protein
MRLIHCLVASVSLLARICGAAPSVSVVSNTQLDAKGIFFVSFDGGLSTSPRLLHVAVYIFGLTSG